MVVFRVAMAEQLLDGADVVAALEQVGGEAVAQRVAARPLGEPRLAHRARHRALNRRLVEVMAALDAGGLLAVARGGREDPLPGPRTRRARKLPCERIRKRHRSEAALEVAFMKCAGAFVLEAERSFERDRKRRHAVLAPLAVADADLVRGEVEILHAQRERFEQPQARPIEEARHESRYPVESREHRANLGRRQHHRQSPRLARAHQLVELGHVAPEHAPVQEDDRVERLVLRRRGHAALDRQMVQEGSDRLGPELGRVPLAVKQDEAPRPMHIRRLGARTRVADAESNADLVEQTRRRASGSAKRARRPAFPIVIVHEDTPARTRDGRVLREFGVRDGTEHGRPISTANADRDTQASPQLYGPQRLTTNPQPITPFWATRLLPPEGERRHTGALQCLHAAA